MLIDLGADPNHINAYGNNPLTKATQNGNYEVAKLQVYGGADPNSHDRFSYAPLASTKEVRSSRFIELFTKEGANIDHAGIHLSVQALVQPLKTTLRLSLIAMCVSWTEKVIAFDGYCHPFQHVHNKR